jgi:hypothetical protein
MNIEQYLMLWILLLPACFVIWKVTRKINDIDGLNYKISIVNKTAFYNNQDCKRKNESTRSQGQKG